MESKDDPYVMLYYVMLCYLFTYNTRFKQQLYRCRAYNYGGGGGGGFNGSLIDHWLMHRTILKSYINKQESRITRHHDK